MNHRILGWVALSVLLVHGLAGVETRAADKAQIQQALTNGAAWIKAGMKEKRGSHKSLANVALLKAGEPHDSPLMLEAVADINAKIKSGGVYEPAGDQIYEAGVDITLLADLDGEKYLPQIQAIAHYIISNQSPQGHWNYLPPRNERERTGGDISVSQCSKSALACAKMKICGYPPQGIVREVPCS